MRQCNLTVLFLLFFSLGICLMWILNQEEKISIKSRLSMSVVHVGGDEGVDLPSCNITVKDILLELLIQLTRSGVKLLLTQVEDLSDESDFVESVFLNTNVPVTRVGVFEEYFYLLDAAIRNTLRYCSALQRKDIILDNTDFASTPTLILENITTHLFLIIPLHDPSIPELEVSSTKQKKLFNWKRIHFQIIYKRGVSTNDQPQAYRWIGEESDDALLFNRPAESYEAFSTRPIRDVKHKVLFQVPRDKRFFIWEKEAAEFKECPVHRKADQKKYQHRTKGMTETDPEGIRKYMTSIMAVKRLMQRHRIHSWLNCGTLLGWHRQCSLIPGDADIDLMHFSKPDAYPSIHADILKQKDVLRVIDKNIVLGNHLKGVYWELGVKSGIKVDAYMVESHKLIDLHGRASVEFTDNICSADLHGYRVYVLCTRTKDILKANYGENFMTPK